VRTSPKNLNIKIELKILKIYGYKRTLLKIFF
jgi:hypothetical protein